MDEVRMVRDGYPEPVPPTAREIASAKALLTEPPRRARPAAVGTGRCGRGGRRGGRGAHAHRREHARPPPPAPVRLDDKSAILAAAEKAERQPTGNHWHLDRIDGQSYIMRPTTGTYAITGATSESFDWWGARSGMGGGYYGRDLPAHPSTARAAALWRRAGSPSSFRVWSSDHYSTYSATAQKWQLNGPERGTNPRGGGGFLGGLSAKDLSNLPTDKAALAEMFMGETAMKTVAGLKSADAGVTARMKIMRVSALVSAPVAPKARAGLMRALADQPGIHSIGRDTDPLARKGVALASDERTITVTGEYGDPKAERVTYRSRTLIIFDERTGAMLSVQDEPTKPGGPYSEMEPGFVINYLADRSTGWTDARPRPPAGLPFG